MMHLHVNILREATYSTLYRFHILYHGCVCFRFMHLHELEVLKQVLKEQLSGNVV